MKILAIGKNYVNDLKDVAAVKNGKQVIFSKPESSLVLNNNDVEFPSFTEELFYEIELVLKIGKKGKNISEDDAETYISEIAMGIDYTAKDILSECRENKGPWDLAKGFDGAAPLSKFISVDKFPDLSSIKFDLKINGEQKQIGNSAMMIYSFKEIISYLSKFMTLEPGDLIFTGTPATGAGKNIKGDHLVGALEGEVLIDYKLT